MKRHLSASGENRSARGPRPCTHLTGGSDLKEVNVEVYDHTGKLVYPVDGDGATSA